MSVGDEGRRGLAPVAWLGLLALGVLWARPSVAVRSGDTASRPAPAHGAAAADQAGGVDRDGENDRDSGNDRGPGEEHPEGGEVASGIRGYAIGLGLAAFLTLVSFALPGNALVWGPAVPAALIVLAIAQMGVHLVFFLHLTTGPDNINNAMALAFGCLIVLLVIGGSLWIMAHLNHSMMPTSPAMQMQMQR